MPRRTKELTENVENEVINKVSSIKSSSSKTAKTGKATVKRTTSTSKKDDNIKASSNKSTTEKTTKKASSKTTSKGTKTKTPAKKTTKTVSKKAVAKKVEILEYYDLPYRYNQTIVKILAQTPTTLFVYWDISDEDKNNYIKQYGEYFFNNTKPVLLVHNITKNYSFEVDINDFANSWYLRVEDSNCDYKIELGRRPVNNYISISNDYLFISSSNNIKSPNDHILFESMPNNVIFKNVKTNKITQRAIIHYLTKFENSYSIKNFYKEMYKDENINFDKLMLNNPSSSSTFK